MSNTVTSEIVACPRCGTKNRVPAAAGGHPRCGSCQRDLPWLVAAGDGDYAEVVERSSTPVLLDCWAAWCGPCHSVAPLVERLAEQYAGRLKVVKVDVDQAPGVAGRLGVQGIPALFLLRDGEVREQLVGARPLPDLEAAVERLLAG